jgi:hypothetical protein
VSASLRQWLAARGGDPASPKCAQPVVLLGLLGSSQEHGGATTGMVVRMFQPAQYHEGLQDGATAASQGTPATGATPGRDAEVPNLEPLELRTLNLSASLGHHAAGDWGGSGAAFSAALGMLPPSSSAALSKQLAAIAAASTSTHVKGVEDTYEALLAQLRQEVVGGTDGGSPAEEEQELAQLQDRTASALLKLQQQVEGWG